MVRNFHQLGTLAAVCDASDVAQEFAKRAAPEAIITGRFEDVLVPQIDAVVIATPWQSW